MKVDGVVNQLVWHLLNPVVRDHGDAVPPQP